MKHKEPGLNKLTKTEMLILIKLEDMGADRNTRDDNVRIHVNI